MTIGTRDRDGWRVPQAGTKARIIYGLLKYGLSSREIARVAGYRTEFVSVVISKNGWLRQVDRGWRDNPTVSPNDEGLDGIDRYK
jgi:hypothetical protein